MVVNTDGTEVYREDVEPFNGFNVVIHTSIPDELLEGSYCSDDDLIYLICIRDEKLSVSFTYFDAHKDIHVFIENETNMLYAEKLSNS